MRAICVLLALCAAAHAQSKLIVRDIGPASSPETIEFRGLAAGEFDPRLWESGKLNLVRDARWPLLEPREGKFRNIYAPSIVKTPAGWTIFYGGWDGTDSGNDRIYRVDTPDFIEFRDRRTVIKHGDFRHVCNVSAIEAGDGFEMLCTVFPDALRRNKPAFFRLASDPLVADVNHIIQMAGYPNFDDADINGMNVLLRDGERYRMYFNNFRDGGKTFRANSDDGKHFAFDGVALQPSAIVNDVRRIGEWYVMALHENGGRLFVTQSRDPMRFAPMRTLATSVGEPDRYIVSVGFATDGEKLLGLLYGAGASGHLNQNRIFALWLQKRLVIDKSAEPIVAFGPDRQLIRRTKALSTSLRLFADDGETAIAAAENVQLVPGRAYEVTCRP